MRELNFIDHLVIGVKKSPYLFLIIKADFIQSAKGNCSSTLEIYNREEHPTIGMKKITQFPKL